jgi:hypothetical protein
MSAHGDGDGALDATLRADRGTSPPPQLSSGLVLSLHRLPSLAVSSPHVVSENTGWPLSVVPLFAS